MPDFTNLDPSLVASFWIYFVGSFFVGVGIGAIVSKLFFHRHKEILDQERQGYLDRIKSLEEKEKILQDKNKELEQLLEQLKADVSNNELYWNAKKYDKQKKPGDKALFDLMHTPNRNNE